MPKVLKSNWSALIGIDKRLAPIAVRRQVLWLLVVLLLIVGISGFIAGSFSSQLSSSFQSGGLGLTVGEFERLHNLPTKVLPTPIWHQGVGYEEGRYILDLWYNDPRNQNFDDAPIQRIVLEMPEKDHKEIMAEARKMLPMDAVLKETKEITVPPPSEMRGIHLIIDTYHSKSLEKRYLPLPSAPDPWKDQIPGTIIITTRPEGGRSRGASIQADLASLPRVDQPPPTRPPTRTPFNSLTPAPPPKPVYTMPMPEPSIPLPIPSPRR